MEQLLSGPEMEYFFSYPDHDELVDRVWAAGANEQALVEVAAKAQVLPRARLIAAEVLWERQFTRIFEIGDSTIASIYCQALADNILGVANPWGLLFQVDDAGTLGSRLISLQEGAIPSLKILLQNENRGPMYEGSKEATVGNSRQYRIKDFAAYYIAKIRNYELPWKPVLTERDAAIAEMRKALDL